MDEKYLKRDNQVFDRSIPEQNETYERLDAMSLTPHQAARCVSSAFRKVKKDLSSHAVYYLQSFVDLYEINLKSVYLEKDELSCMEVIQCALTTGYSNGMEKIPNGELKLALKQYLKCLAIKLVKEMQSHY